MKIFFLGRYNSGDVLSGPEKAAKRIFVNTARLNGGRTVFIEYFFDDYSTSVIKKLFGCFKRTEVGEIYRLGIIRMLFLLIKEKPDIIHIVTAERFIIPVLLAGLLYKGRIVVTMHSVLRDELRRSIAARSKYDNFKDLLYERLAIYTADRIIVVSNLLKALLLENYKTNESKIAKIPNGADSSFLSRDSFPEIRDEVRIVIYNGGTENNLERGNLNLVRSIPEITEKRIRIFVIGNTFQTPDAELKNEVQFVEPMSESGLKEFLKDKHIILKSSSFDSFSLLILECMIGGIVPVISNNVGISEYIENGINGFVYNKDNRTEAGNILKEIAKGKYRLEEISAEARKIYLKLNWGNIAAKYMMCYREAS